MEIIKINRDNYEEEILNSKSKVLVDFYTTWCGPCRMIAPILEELAKEKDIKIASIDVDENENYARTNNIFTIPCLVLFENGKEIKRKVGLMSKDEILELIGE